MALVPPAPGLLPVEVFPNAGGGFGYGVTKRQSRPEGYDRTLNMSVRDGDVLSPAFGGTRTSLPGTASTPPPAFAVAWQTADTQPVPIFLGAVGPNVYSYINAASALDFASAGENYGFAFHDDGAGVEYLYVGVSLTLSYLQRRTQAGVWTVATDPVPQLVRAKYLVSAAGALWRSTSDWQVSKCPAGSEPFTLASWGAAIPVGTNYGQITAMGALGAAPVVFRTDGIYVYNTADNLFENQFPVDPHPDNFPFARADGAGGLYSALHDGSIVHITRFGSISVIHPLRGKTPQRDTPRGPITDIAVWSDRLFGFMAPAYRLVQPPGLIVLKTINNMSTFTDYSSAVLDTSAATVADFSSLPSGAGGGYILIGFDQPILAAQFVMNLFNTSVVNTLSGEISTGAGTWASVALIAGGVKDISARSFGRSGIVAVRSAATVSAWALATYNGNSKFWLRLALDVALPASVTVSTMAVVVKRPAPDFGDASIPNFASWEASGLQAKVLMGTVSPAGIVWDDLYTAPTEAPGGKLAVTTLPMGNSPGACLMAITANRILQWPLPNILESSVVEYPDLARDAGSVPPFYYPSAVDLETIHALRYVEIIGQNLVEGSDSWGFSWRWDDRNAWDNDKTGVGVEKTTNALFRIDDQSGGTVLHVAVQLLDSANSEPVGPSGRRVICWVEPLPARASQQVEPVRPALEVA